MLAAPSPSTSLCLPLQLDFSIVWQKTVVWSLCSQIMRIDVDGVTPEDVPVVLKQLGYDMWDHQAISEAPCCSYGGIRVHGFFHCAMQSESPLPGSRGSWAPGNEHANSLGPLAFFGSWRPCGTCKENPKP